MKQSSDAILHADQAAYLESIETPRDPLLDAMERHAAAEGQPISDPEVASFLAVTARLARPKLVVEVGTNIGYGAIVLARAAGPDAKVITLEKDPAIAAKARGFIAEAGLAAQIEVRCVDALEGLDALEGPIDLAYVDCVKNDYPAYLARLVPKLGPFGVLVADNVLWKGYVARTDVPEGERARVDALRAFNRAITGDPRLRGVVLPLGDGVAYAIRA